MHPLVDKIVSQEDGNVTASWSLLGKEVEKLEFDYGDNDNDEIRNIINGVDMFRYSEFSTSANELINYDRMYTAYSYTLLHQRNMKILLENIHKARASSQLHLQELEAIRDEYDTNLSRKRKEIQDLNNERKRRQVEQFKPLGDFLENKWKGTLKSLVDLGIQRQIYRAGLD